MAIGVFLGILLLTLNRGNKKANRLLGTLMLLAAFFIGGFAYTKFHLYLEAPHFIEIAPAFIFLLGPVFYFYVKALTEENPAPKWKAYLHFIPFLLLILYLSPFFFQNAAAKFLEYDTRDFERKHRTIIIIQLIHVLVYLFIIRGFVKNYTLSIKTHISGNAGIKLSWISFSVNLLIFILGLNLFIMAFSLVDSFLGLHLIGVNFQRVNSALTPALISFIVFALGFRGLMQPVIFPFEAESLQNKKYEKSTLTDEQARKSLEELLALMKEEKLYLQRDLTLQKLADRLSISSHHLSQIINEKLGQNFFDFINSYRIEEAKRLLMDGRGEALTILAISEEVGFNSKSSFNSAFKKHTGKTPKQFKQ